MADPVEIFKRLDRKLIARARELEPAEKYLMMEQPLKYMAPALEEEFGERLTQLIIDLPSVIVEAYESVLDVQGFAVPDHGLRSGSEPSTAAVPSAQADQAAEMTWDIWKANNMQEQMPLLQTESIGLGNAFIISGPGESQDDAPIMTVESPMQVFAERDPRSRTIIRAVKRWAEDDGTGKVVQWGNLYPVSYTHLTLPTTPYV